MAAQATSRRAGRDGPALESNDKYSVVPFTEYLDGGGDISEGPLLFIAKDGVSRSTDSSDELDPG